MGMYKDEGNPAIALMEECAEVIQVIAKYQRFDGNWNEIAPGKIVSKWQELKSEMDDLMYQWERLKHEQGESSWFSK